MPTLPRVSVVPSYMPQIWCLPAIVKTTSWPVRSPPHCPALNFSLNPAANLLNGLTSWSNGVNFGQFSIYFPAGHTFINPGRRNMWQIKNLFSVAPVPGSASLFKLAGPSFLMLLLAIWTTNLSAQTNVVVIRPTDIPDLLVNPGMGITTFQRFNGQALNSPSEWSERGPEAKLPQASPKPDFPETSISYCRWYWDTLE